MINDKKKCTKCNLVLPIENFFKSGKHESGTPKTRGDCKDCCAKEMTKWRERNRSKYNSYSAMWRAKNPDKQHATDIKRLYKMSIEDYNAMLIEQNMSCAICKKQHDPSLKRGRLYVDHCHKPGKKRALLCGACNSMLGYANDSTEILKKAIAYLKKHQT